ncbi:MAG: DUF6754 domain-containing protein [Anaerolineaceae bacterium]|jgi:hypothetical protein
MWVITLNDWVAAGMVLLGILTLLFVRLFTQKAPYDRLAKVSAWKSLGMLMNQTAEQGKRLTLGLGSIMLMPQAQPGSLLGLSILRMVARHSTFNDHPSQTVSGDGSLALLSQMILHGVYANSVVPELFKPDDAVLCGTSPSAYIAGLMPEVNMPYSSGVVLAGHQGVLSALVLDLADRKKLESVSGTDDITAQAAQFVSPGILTIGEDVYTPAASLETDAGSAAHVRAADFLRVFLTLALLTGAILKLVGVWP